METLPPKITNQPKSPEGFGEKEPFNSEEVVNWVQENGVEVKSPEQLVAQTDSLVTAFEIDTEILKEGRNKLLLSAIANELGDDPFGENAKTSGRVADMIALAFGEKTRFRDDFAEGGYEPGFSERRTKEAYEFLTDTELSANLDAYIHTNKAFNLVRERLGLTPETEKPFEVRVLNVGSDNTMHNWQPPVDWAGLPGDEALAQHETQKARAEELRQNESYLIAETGADSEQGLPPAWVNTDSQGNVTLCMPLPIAEKLLNYDPAGEQDSSSSENHANEQAIVLHEFTHTQERVIRGDHIGLGIALEELRAEHFSGDRHGYTEIKRYFSSIKTLYGYSPKDSFEKGGAFNQDDFELDIARNLGLEGYLDAMTVMPNTYAEDSSTNAFIGELVAADGGIDGHFDKMYARAIEEFGEEEVARRISATVDIVAKHHATLSSPTVSVQALLSYQRPSGFAKMAVLDYEARY